MNSWQKGFLYRLLLVFGLPLLGSLLMWLGDGQVLPLPAAGDAQPALLAQLGGLLMLLGSILSITTLRYGKRYKANISRTRKFAALLLTYRLLFWISVVVSVLSGVLLIWLVTHLGPVR